MLLSQLWFTRHLPFLLYFPFLSCSLAAASAETICLLRMERFDVFLLYDVLQFWRLIMMVSTMLLVSISATHELMNVITISFRLARIDSGSGGRTGIMQSLGNLQLQAKHNHIYCC